MSSLASTVESKIREILPDKFALVFDGWTLDGSSTHYIALYARWMNGTTIGNVLLAFAPLADEHDYTATSHMEFMVFHLEKYGKSLDNVICFVGDNVSVNQAMATICEKPLVGCAAHRFNLEVQNYLKSWESLLSKVNAVMVKLGTLKNSALLRKYTSLRPVKRCATRWLGAYLMLKRYQKIKEFIHTISNEDQQLAELLPTFAEERSLTLLCEHLKNLSSVMSSLQGNDRTLSDARILFDSVMAKYPSMHVYISTDADILHSPTFDSAIIKILRGESNLTEEEMASVTSLQVPLSEEQVPVQTNSPNIPGKSSFASMAFDSYKKKHLTNSQYTSPAFIPCSSAMVESLFSVAGHVFFSRRLGVSREHLEQQLFLKVNSDLWDLETVSVMVGEDNQEDADVASESEEIEIDFFS